MGQVWRLVWYHNKNFFVGDIAAEQYSSIDRSAKRTLNLFKTSQYKCKCRAEISKTNSMNRIKNIVPGTYGVPTHNQKVKKI